MGDGHRDDVSFVLAVASEQLQHGATHPIQDEDAGFARQSQRILSDPARRMF